MNLNLQASIDQFDGAPTPIGQWSAAVEFHAPVRLYLNPPDEYGRIRYQIAMLADGFGSNVDVETWHATPKGIEQMISAVRHGVRNPQVIRALSYER